ncbi:MAG: hypothetical protein AAGF27_06710 [Pseudomonadota bacterium]
MMQPDIIHSRFEIMTEMVVGTASQMRYVQGDAAAILVLHDGHWQRVPLGGLIVGHHGEITVRNIYGHRPSNVLLEMAARVVDVIPQKTYLPGDPDRRYMHIDWKYIPGSANGRVILAAAPGYSARVHISDLGQAALTFIKMRDPLPADRPQLGNIPGIGVLAQAELGETEPTAFNAYSLQSWPPATTAVRVSADAPIMVHDCALLMLDLPQSARATEITLIRAELTGVVGA